MRKISQKYNKIREKAHKNSMALVVFGRQKVKNFLDLEKAYIKNTLAAALIFFLGSFSFCMVSSAEEIKNMPVAVVPVVKINRNIELEKRIIAETNGYPIEKMTRVIAKQDEQVAAFLIAIAKKESNWGKRTPKLKGQECFNLWGFREKRERMGSGGHTCFDSPEDAVNSVAERIKDLIAKDVDTPAKMIVWKCGYSCEAHNPQSVEKWISDVGLYYNKF